ncbi:MAG: imidazolonepropionase [Bradymonadia bacterium]
MSEARHDQPAPLDLVVEGASEIYTAAGPIYSAGTLIGVHDGTVVFLGTERALEESAWHIGGQTRRLHARGGLITPGLVECHTHIVFAGDRSGEYARRATGVPYLEIARAGGGIAATVRATRAASLEDLVREGRGRLDQLVGFGVTTCEVKSGYGLDLPTELKMLQAVKALDDESPVDLVGTFLGAHTVPPEHKADRQRYLDLVVDEMIPAVAEQGLARFCDVFVEAEAFSSQEGARVLQTGLDHGLTPKVHADQLSGCGGAELAARMDAVSADHLEYVSASGIQAMAASGTVAVLLPGASMFLGQDVRPPARALIDAGVNVALSTDCNPGTCRTENLQLMMTLGMSRLGMSPSEVLDAVTVNAARAIGLEDEAGMIAVGRAADLAIFDVASHVHLPYHFGVNHTRTVVKAGKVIFDR